MGMRREARGDGVTRRVEAAMFSPTLGTSNSYIVSSPKTFGLTAFFHSTFAPTSTLARTLSALVARRLHEGAIPPLFLLSYSKNFLPE